MKLFEKWYRCLLDLWKKDKKKDTDWKVELMAGSHIRIFFYLLELLMMNLDLKRKCNTKAKKNDSKFKFEKKDNHSKRQYKLTNFNFSILQLLYLLIWDSNSGSETCIFWSNQIYFSNLVVFNANNLRKLIDFSAQQYMN